MSSVLLCILLSVPEALAQAERARPVRESAVPADRQRAPVRESGAAPLPAKKLEEALQLLLRATSDSATTSTPSQRATEIGGLVVDQTITKVGHDFYDVFYTQFEAPAGSTEYIVTITEKPGRGTNTLVTVTVNENDLLEMPLQPKPEYIEAAATDAVSAAVAFLQEAASLSRQLERGGKQPLEKF